MVKQKLLTRTHFEKRLGEKSGAWQWFWRTEAPNGESVAVGGEGYHNLSGAVNGFFSGQGDVDWKPGQPIPVGYVQEKFDAQHYVITHHGEE